MALLRFDMYKLLDRSLREAYLTQRVFYEAVVFMGYVELLS